MEPLTALGLALVALIGLCVGTVVDSVVARVPQGAGVLASLRPQCSCGTARRGRDLVPLLWLTRSDRGCPECGVSSGGRRLTLEVTCAGVFLVFAVLLQLSWELPAYLYFGALGLALAAIDLEVRRLPNALTVPAYPIFGALLLLPTLADGLWANYARAAVGGVALFGIYLVLALVNPGGMGMGDVKLAGVLGMALAWFGWPVWVLGTVSGFLLAGLVGAVLLVTGRAGRRTTIPFGPFMVTGAFLGLVAVPLVAGLALAVGALG
jgi:leader peptidase (prepilin peptidase)/N-methyltransferase